MALLLLFASGGGSSGDVIAPTVSSATISSDGETLTVVMSEAATFGAGGVGGLALSMSGGAVTATYTGGSGTTVLLYSLSRVVYDGEIGTHSYTQPGDGIVDLADPPNEMVSYSGELVTNGSTVAIDSDELGVGGIVLYVSPNSSVRSFTIETAEGDVTKVTVDWTAFADYQGSDVESVAWSVTSGGFSVSTPTTSGNLSRVRITTADDSKGCVKVVATLVDGQKSTIKINIRSRGERLSGDYW